MADNTVNKGPGSDLSADVPGGYSKRAVDQMREELFESEWEGLTDKNLRSILREGCPGYANASDEEIIQQHREAFGPSALITGEEEGQNNFLAGFACEVLHILHGPYSRSLGAGDWRSDLSDQEIVKAIEDCARLRDLLCSQQLDAIIERHPSYFKDFYDGEAPKNVTGLFRLCWSGRKLR